MTSRRAEFLCLTLLRPHLTVGHRLRAETIGVSLGVWTAWLDEENWLVAKRIIPTQWIRSVKKSVWQFRKGATSKTLMHPVSLLTEREGEGEGRWGKKRFNLNLPSFPPSEVWFALKIHQISSSSLLFFSPWDAFCRWSLRRRILRRLGWSLNTSFAGKHSIPVCCCSHSNCSRHCAPFRMVFHGCTARWMIRIAPIFLYSVFPGYFGLLPASLAVRVDLLYVFATRLPFGATARRCLWLPVAIYVFFLRSR